MNATNDLKKPTDIARRFYDYLNAKPVTDWRDILAPDWNALPALPEVPDQIAGYCMMVDQLRTGVPDLVVENVEVIANEDVVAVRSLVSGTNTGILFGNPPTGKPFTFTAMDIHRIVGGKIVQTWHVEDFAGMMAQLT
ncbi:MAG: ester cyclase [Bacteroidota bacterium]|nr:ester cyclase [Bacteroidota bacterium]